MLCCHQILIFLCKTYRFRQYVILGFEFLRTNSRRVSGNVHYDKVGVSAVLLEQLAGPQIPIRLQSKALQLLLKTTVSDTYVRGAVSVSMAVS